MADLSSATRLVQRAREDLGRIDILVLNAGGPPAGRWDEFDATRYVEAMTATAGSAIAAVETVVPDMRANGWGRVVAITSQTVREPLDHLALSGVARTALTAFLKTMSNDVAAQGITVNTVQPGSHETDRLRSLLGDRIDSAAEAIPVRRLGDPDDFGRVVAFLCSESARFITGVSIPVDGGVSHGLQ
jgi:3-oxoacyl-[acyl-carrier protein] reductase